MTKIKKNQFSPVKLILYENNFIFIIEELKKYFDVERVYYLLCNYQNKRYIMYRYMYEIPLNVYSTLKRKPLTDMCIKYLRKIYIFKYLLCLLTNNDKTILMNSMLTKKIDMTHLIIDYDLVYAFSFYNHSYSIIKNDKRLEIPKKDILKWFSEKDKDSYVVFTEEMEEMVKDIDITKFREDLISLSKKYNMELNEWINTVYNKIYNIKDLMNNN